MTLSADQERVSTIELPAYSSTAFETLCTVGSGCLPTRIDVSLAISIASFAAASDPSSSLALDESIEQQGPFMIRKRMSALCVT
ncbi:hypothetical protein H2248_007074 [Termitomyces sp. 'cryptogamus']|nr:hypothetical protein H2248_007074 [Termitomyces sp. 'cryptogamus']